MEAPDAPPLLDIFTEELVHTYISKQALVRAPTPPLINLGPKS